MVKVSLHRFLRQFHCLLARMADKADFIAGLSVCAHWKTTARLAMERISKGSQERFHFTAPQVSANEMMPNTRVERARGEYSPSIVMDRSNV